LEEMSLGFEEDFFFVEGLGAMGVFIWATIRLKYHPASRLRWQASNEMRGKNYAEGRRDTVNRD
jgi:hypothetical protein